MTLFVISFVLFHIGLFTAQTTFRPYYAVYMAIGYLLAAIAIGRRAPEMLSAIVSVAGFCALAMADLVQMAITARLVTHVGISITQASSISTVLPWMRIAGWGAVLWTLCQFAKDQQAETTQPDDLFDDILASRPEIDFVHWGYLVGLLFLFYWSNYEILTGGPLASYITWRKLPLPAVLLAGSCYGALSWLWLLLRDDSKRQNRHLTAKVKEEKNTMSQRSDIKGMVFCTFAAIVGLGAAAGCYFGLLEIVTSHPKANIGTTVAAGLFSLLMFGGIATYISQRQSLNRDDSEK